ncbi:hypothetical protein CMU89_16435 [Elizabethkingia anophelis]|nr:hypothetical protein [Elizabethkingia anophelis]MDV3544231.1 hypothetical protein [Elizabethkingia anophelis]
MKLLFIDIYTHIIYYTISGYMPDISFSVICKEEIRAKKCHLSSWKQIFPDNAYNKNPVFKSCRGIYRVCIEKEIPSKVSIILNFSHPYSGS